LRYAVGDAVPQRLKLGLRIVIRRVARTIRAVSTADDSKKVQRQAY